MICRACSEGRHNECEQSGCECAKQMEANFEKDLAAYVNAQGDEGLAETIYSDLMASGSGVVRMFTDGAGKPAVRLFIQQVLRANRALKG